MESWIVRKKRTMMTRRGKNKNFNNLPTEIQSEILKRLGGSRNASIAMCVSNTWRDLVLHTTLPMERQTVVTACMFPHPSSLEHLFHWCSKVMCCKVTPRKLIDACNGLLLFCHKDGEAGNIITPGVFHYYVINRVTKQCVAVLKPARPHFVGYSYAALAYDPVESWFFKIVRFQGRRHVNVFSSKTGCWTTLTLHLPPGVNETQWIKKSVYLKGAIYRLSKSGHLIKILVDLQENVENQAQVITLPQIINFSGSCHWDIKVIHDKVTIVMSASAWFFIFELVEGVTRAVHSFKWILIRCIKDLELWSFNSYGELLCFLPHDSIAFYKRKTMLFFYYLARNNIKGPAEVPHEETLYEYIRHCGFSLPECSNPFACRLVKEHPRLFWHLPIPDN